MRTNDINYASLSPPIIRTQNHMNGTDVINTLSEGGGSWGHGMQEAQLKLKFAANDKPMVEHQYYGDYHAESTVGYVKNMTYNIATLGCNTNFNSDYKAFKSISNDDVKIGQKIKIISLKNLTHYYVDWYSYQYGNYIKTDYKKTNINGDLKLKFPTLSSDNPVVWYVVHQYAYSGLMQTDAPLVERKNIYFEFQPIETDTTSSHFRNEIYPNPFDNIINVQNEEEDEFFITTLTGDIVMKCEVHKGINHVNVQNLPKGLYFGELKNQRFITKIERL